MVTGMNYGNYLRNGEAGSGEASQQVLDEEARGVTGEPIQNRKHALQCRKCLPRSAPPGFKPTPIAACNESVKERLAHHTASVRAEAAADWQRHLVHHWLRCCSPLLLLQLPVITSHARAS